MSKPNALRQYNWLEPSMRELLVAHGTPAYSIPGELSRGSWTCERHSMALIRSFYGSLVFSILDGSVCQLGRSWP